MKCRDERQQKPEPDQHRSHNHKCDQRIHEVHQTVRQIVLHALESTKTQKQNQRERQCNAVCHRVDSALDRPRYPLAPGIQFHRKPEQQNYDDVGPCCGAALFPSNKNDRDGNQRVADNQQHKRQVQRAIVSHSQAKCGTQQRWDQEENLRAAMK